MKIWIKLLIGIVLGIILGVVIPESFGGDLFDNLTKIFINIGRYAIYPLIFFSLIIGTYELKLERNIIRSYGFTFFYMILSTFICVLIGVLSAVIFSPERIPVIPVESDKPNIPGLSEALLNVFPRNFFDAIVGNGNFILPLLVVAFVLGANLTFDKGLTKPIVQFIDTLSRLFYHINSLIVEIFAIALIAITASSVIKIISIVDNSMYIQLVIVLLIDLAVIVFGIFPLLFYFLTDRRNPYKHLYAITGPLLTALATGDEYISLGMLVKHSKENLSIPRTIGSSTYPVFALFGKGGTALIASVAFIVIIKSIKYDISFQDVIWVIGFSFLVSFALSSVPGSGAFVAIALLSTLYGKGYQDAYLIFKQIAPLLISIGVVIDVAAAAFSSFLLAYQRGIRSKVEAQDFI
jgi:aerobic C4-dicarboxylate transport protein